MVKSVHFILHCGAEGRQKFVKIGDFKKRRSTPSAQFLHRECEVPAFLLSRERAWVILNDQL